MHNTIASEIASPTGDTKWAQMANVQPVMPAPSPYQAPTYNDGGNEPFV